MDTTQSTNQTAKRYTDMVTIPIHIFGLNPHQYKQTQRKQHDNRNNPTTTWQSLR